MANKFDENKYKQMFEQRYGNGSFDSGLSQARDIGRLKVQASMAKTDYTARLKAAQKAAMKKTYNDATAYWNDPTNKVALQKDGAYRAAEKIKNDPNKQAEIKAQGYNLSDYYDAMYNAASNGQYKSEREYNQYAKQLNKDTAPNRKANQDSIQMVIDSDKAKAAAQAKNSKTPALIKKPVEQSKQKDSNWFIDSQKWLDKKILSPIENTVGHYATNFANELSLGQLKKSAPKDAPKFLKDWSAPPKNKAEKAADTLGTLSGFVAPVGGAYKATGKAAEGIYKGLTLGKDLGKFAKYGKDAVKGATAMAAYSTANEGLDAALHPNDATSQERLKNVGINTALGAIGDPAFRLVGAGLKKGAEVGLQKLIKGDFPKSNGKISNDVLDKLAPLRKENLPANNNQPLSVDTLFNVKRAHNPSQPLNEFLGKQQADSPLMKLAKKNMYTNRNLPIFSNANAAVQKNPSLAELLPKVATDRKMPDFSFGKAKSEPIQPVNQFGVEVPFDKVVNAPADYWRGRYEEFAKYVNQNYDTNRLNKEVLDELWTHFAHKDEPVTLEKLVELAHPSNVKETPVLDARNVNINRRPASQKAKDILGINDSAFQLPTQASNQPINAADVWGKMGNRPPVSQNAKKILGINDMQNPFPNRSVPNKVQANPLQVLKDLNVTNPNQSQPGTNLLENLKVLSNKGTAPQSLLPRLPETAPNGLQERGHINTLRNSQNAVDEVKSTIKGMYQPTTNAEAVNIANKQIAQGLETATSFVKSARVLKPEHVATAHRLIQEFQKSGQINKAVDIAEHIAEQGTKAGQAVQAYSIFDKLSPEGILVHAHRVADRVNAKLGPAQEKVTINEDTANQLTDLATTVQKMTNQKTVANDVINIMDKAKAGAKLSDEETKSIRQFVDDAKQFVSDIQPKNTKPKAPNKIISPEVKNHVITFLDKQEEAARKRLAARKNRALSGLPVDDFYDYAVIGASKLAKGTVHFADFSEQMIREFGQEVGPHVQQIYDKASEMVNSEVKRTTNRLSEVEKLTNKALKNGKLEANDAESLRKFAISIGNMSGDAKIEASQELQATLQALERPSLLQKISAAQTIMQLFNPKTLGRNAIGNELFYRLERINKLVATPIDWTRSKLTGGERTITFVTNNQGDYWKNWLKGAKAGLKGVNPEGLATQYDLHPKSFNGKWNPLTHLEKGLGASLKSFDYAGYKRAVNNTIGELATLRAMNEGLTGQAQKQAIERYIREVDDNVLMIADQYGKYATFQDNNILSVGLQKFKRGLNFGKEFGMGDLIIKYPKTPGALLARSLEYSPAGFLKSAYQIARPMYEGNKINPRDVTESFTRALIGSAGVSGIAWFLADKGILSGTGSKDLDVANLEKQAGKAPYSLNTDALGRWVASGFNPDAAETQEGDQFVTYNWAQPIATGISIGVNVNQNVKQSGHLDVGQAASGALGGAIDTMVEQSVLQGVKKAFTSYPGQTTGDKITDIAGDLPASFVPTLFNQVRQLTDNTTRNTYDPSKLQTFINRAKNKVPGVASSLPPAFSTLGKKQEVYQDKSNTLFNVLLNPSFVSRYNPSPEAKMALDIINATGDNTVAPRGAQKYLIIDGKRHDLTTEQYSIYQQRLGSEVRSELQGLLPLAGISNKEMLGKEVNKILDKAGRKVRTELKQEFR